MTAPLLDPIDAALQRARQSAARQRQAAAHCVSGEAKRLQLRDSRDRADKVVADLQRARDAVADLHAAAVRAERFISNGLELGYIRLPAAPDPALDTLPALQAAIAGGGQ